MKPYGIGLIVGRFQTFHTGHKMMIDTAVKLCGRVIVLIGSAQESGTETNPFTYEQRKMMIEKSCKRGIEIYPINDIGVGNNSKWGDHVIDHVKNYCGAVPDLFVSGKESRRVDWFDTVKDIDLAELYIPKSIDISASKMRRFMTEGDKKSWRAFTPRALWGDFDSLRLAVIAAEGNKETKSI